MSLRDAAALLRLQREIDREAAGQAAGTTAQWEVTLREALWAARRHLGGHWEPFVADIRANQQLAAMWGPARQSGTAPGTFPSQEICRVKIQPPLTASGRNATRRAGIRSAEPV